MSPQLYGFLEPVFNPVYYGIKNPKTVLVVGCFHPSEPSNN